MGLFDMFKRGNIDEGIERFRATPGAVLIDVREAREYTQGHIPGSINISVQQIANVQRVVPDKETPLFVHCLSGARSSRAVGALQKMGYTNVQNIGGINAYTGPIEKN